MTGTLHATVAPAERPGRHRLEIPALGFSLEHAYPVNRAAKVLDLAGIGGPLLVHDLTTGALLMRVDVVAAAGSMLSEGHSGFKREPWSEKALHSLANHAETVRRAAKDGGNAPSGCGGTGEAVLAVLAGAATGGPGR